MAVGALPATTATREKNKTEKNAAAVSGLRVTTVRSGISGCVPYLHNGLSDSTALMRSQRNLARPPLMTNTMRIHQRQKKCMGELLVLRASTIQSKSSTRVDRLQTPAPSDALRQKTFAVKSRCSEPTHQRVRAAQSRLPHINTRQIVITGWPHSCNPAHVPATQMFTSRRTSHNTLLESAFLHVSTSLPWRMKWIVCTAIPVPSPHYDRTCA